MTDENQTQETVVEENLDDFAKEFFSGNSPTEEDSANDASEDKVETQETNDDSTGNENSPAPEEESNTEEVNENSDDEEEMSEDDSSEDANPKPKKNSYQERVRQLNAKFREQERRAEQAEREAEELRRKLNPEPVKEKIEEKSALDKTNIDHEALNSDGTRKYPLGQYDPQYLKDVVDAALESKEKQLEQKTEEQKRNEAVEAAKQELQSNWLGKVEAVEQEIPDLREKVDSLGEVFEGIEPTYGEYLGNVIMQMDAGPEVLYHLANNIEEAEEIVAAGASKATGMLYRLEASLMLNKSKTQEQGTQGKVSNAPKPPPTNKGSGVVKASVPVDTDNLDAFSKEFFGKK
jgi:hypothetical protein